MSLTHHIGNNSVGAMITIGVKRIFATQPTTTQFFMVAGGPGDSYVAEEFEQSAISLIGVSLAQNTTGMDVPTVYLSDHRGTGTSSPILCTNLCM